MRASVSRVPAMTPRRFLFRLVVAAFALFTLYQLWLLGHVLWWTQFNPSSTAFMEQRLALMREKDPAARLRHEWVPYERISLSLKTAVVAAEDSAFMDHSGFDWEGLRVAFEKNLKKGRVVAGGSTISQQLAKNLFLSGSRTPWRKGQEAIITVMLETCMSKRRILEIYLNMIEWGDGVFGAEAAAQHYYGRRAKNLRPAQAARLAAMIPNPRYYDKRRSTPALNRKTAILQKRMYQVRVPR